MRNFFGSPIKKLRTVDDVEDYLHEVEGSVIGFFGPRDKDLKDVYRKTAKYVRELGLYFGYVTDPGLLAEYGRYAGKIVQVRPHVLRSGWEEGEVVYSGEVDNTSLHQWVIKEWLGTMAIRNSRNDFLFRHPLVVIYYRLES